ncbi:meiotically up-regulated gene 113-domain-containing protein [Halenospora varia]|nr:meiotically up-regulated gene 113-domain-containing protein [Halenospora varia]
MMVASPFLPTLTELRKSEDCKTRQCIWFKKSKKASHPEQCSRTISDGGKTRQFLQRLNGTKDPRVDLADVAALQLCGRSHREKHIELVLDEWIKEIKEERLKSTIPAVSTHPLKSANGPASTPASSQPLVANGRSTRRATFTQPDVSKPLVTPTTIRLTLQIDEGDSLKCHGRTTRNSRCTKPLARPTCIRIDTIVKSLANSYSISSDQSNITSLLVELAPLVLCRGYHQGQAQELSTQWLPKMADTVIFTTVDTENSGHGQGINNPSTPNSKRESSFNPTTPPTIDDSPESTISSMWSSYPQSHFTTPGTSPHRSASQALQNNSPLSSKTGATHTVEALFDDSYVEDPATDFQSNNNDVVRKLFTHQSSNPRKASLRTNHVESLRHTVPKFSPFATQSAQKMLKTMCDVMSRPLSEQDQRLGYIYGFQREENGYIKIGVTKDVEARMQQWANSCHYKPKLVLQIAVPYAFRVERLIQLHLASERCRENLVDGLCNSGSGCPRKHEEWFKIELPRLKKVATLWKRFVESEPYDKKHILKSWWQQHLMKIDLGSHLDPWLHWLEPILDGNPTMAVKKEKANEKLIGVKVEEKYAVKNSEDVITIKEEPDIESGPGETGQEQGIRTPGRQYRMRIKVLQGATKDNTSKSIIGTILDSTLSLDVPSVFG